MTSHQITVLIRHTAIVDMASMDGRVSVSGPERTTAEEAQADFESLAQKANTLFTAKLEPFSNTQPDRVKRSVLEKRYYGFSE